MIKIYANLILLARSDDKWTQSTIGRLTRDIELKFTASYRLIQLTVNRNFTNQQGEREADFTPRNLAKGSGEL